MIELVYRAFEAISHRESSLLHFANSDHLLVLTFYMNDFFEEFKDFDEQYDFLRNHFLPRVK